MVPSCQGETHPIIGETNQQEMQGAGSAEPQGGEGTRLGIVSVPVELAMANVFRASPLTQVCAAP